MPKITATTITTLIALFASAALGQELSHRAASSWPSPDATMPQTQAPYYVARGQSPATNFTEPYSAFPVPTYEGEYEAATTALVSHELAAPGMFDKSTPVKYGVPSRDCLDPWAHRRGLFGEYLHMRARDASVPYAVVSAAGPVVVPLQPVANADAEYQSGFRGGFSHAVNDCTSLVATYTTFDSSAVDTVTTGGTLRSLVMHPGVANAGLVFLDATANHDLDLDLIDLDYRSVLASGDQSAVNYLVGVRYADLTQEFRSVFTGAGTTDTVLSDVDFTGIGLRLGLDAEHHSRHSGFLCYGRGVASLMAGEFRNRYFHGSNTVATIANTGIVDPRFVSVLDFEAGIGWQSQSGRVRLTAGYLFSVWLNAVTTDSWIQSVQSNSVASASDPLSFDSLTARLELRF